MTLRKFVRLVILEDYEYIYYRNVITTKFIMFTALNISIMTCTQKINILVIKMRLQVRV